MARPRHRKTDRARKSIAKQRNKIDKNRMISGVFVTVVVIANIVVVVLVVVIISISVLSLNGACALLVCVSPTRERPHSCTSTHRPTTQARTHSQSERLASAAHWVDILLEAPNEQQQKKIRNISGISNRASASSSSSSSSPSSPSFLLLERCVCDLRFNL